MFSVWQWFAEFWYFDLELALTDVRRRELSLSGSLLEVIPLLFGDEGAERKGDLEK